MNKGIIKNMFLEQFYDHIKQYGFLIKKQLAEFTKKGDKDWNKFQLIFLNRSDGWEINIGMIIRIDIIEIIYHQASSYDIQYHKTTPTLGITMENFINDGTKYRCSLNSASDIETCISYIKDTFMKTALPFFEKFTDLKKLDEVFNIKVGTSRFSGPIDGCCKGIILAKLVKNPDYNFFLEKYYDYYKSFSDGFYLPEYEKLISILDSGDYKL